MLMFKEDKGNGTILAHPYDYFPATSNVTECKQQQRQPKRINNSLFKSERVQHLSSSKFNYIFLLHITPSKIVPSQASHPQICLLKRPRNNDQSSSNERPTPNTQVTALQMPFSTKRNRISLEKWLTLLRQEMSKMNLAYLIITDRKETMEDN